MKQFKIYYLLFLMVGYSCGSLVKNTVVSPKREFRGVWIASVVNIDWPKSGTDPVEKQKKDFIAILEFYKRLNFNAAIVQIRTAGDALYPSKLAPWSRFLTGKEGKAPRPYYDPLAWMIEETHRRGFEFHAWLNPYRATFDLNTDIIHKTHDYIKHPEWMIKYGEKHYYNPGLPEVQKHLVNVINEVLQNYDIDAIHFDDYFYPYKIKDQVFNDQATYQQYSKPEQTLDDWRRENVNTLIQAIHNQIKTQNPWVQFGISPFGVWRNASTDPLGSDTEAGQTTYDDLYADPLSWMQNGWIDYLAPQLYWSLNHLRASHKKLVRWWNNNATNTNIYIGNGAYKIRSDTDKAWQRKNELSKQVSLARKTKNVSGNVFFSAKSLLNKHEDIVQYLSQTTYQKPALPPASTEKEMLDLTPEILSSKIVGGAVVIHFKKNDMVPIRFIVLYELKTKKREVYHLKNSMSIFHPETTDHSISITIPQNTLKDKKNIAITYLDYYRRESKPYIYQIMSQADSKSL